jgi:NAD(P)H dehydrogenase (quinone)
MATKGAIIYSSATGTTYQLARTVEQVASEAGADVRFRNVRELAPDEAIASNQGWAAHRIESQHVPEASLDDLAWADAIIFGTATRYGLPTAQLKQFLDTPGPLWVKGVLVNKIKICSAFTSSGTPYGGQETTIDNLKTTFYHWGAIIVAPGYADPIQFKAGNPYERHSPATMARLNRTRRRSPQHAFRVSVSRNWQPNCRRTFGSAMTP